MLRDRIANHSKSEMMEVPMRRAALITVVSLMLGGLCPAWSAEQDDAALIKAVSGAKVTLQQGLTASQREGRPISGKFEMENGKLQLSVYTEKAGKYFEVNRRPHDGLGDENRTNHRRRRLCRRQGAKRRDGEGQGRSEIGNQQGGGWQSRRGGYPGSEGRAPDRVN